MSRLAHTAFLAAIVAVLAPPGIASATARRNTLTATVGPGFTITMSKKTVKAGTYRSSSTTNRTSTWLARSQ